MSIGYACITVGVYDTALKNCILKNATYERLNEIINHNLTSLENMIDYNIENNIKLFRLSSDLIPFASSSDVSFDWKSLFYEKLYKMGQKAKANSIRLSMHPGQYTILNSPNDNVVKNTIADLKYHTDLLHSMGMRSDSKIVLHIGGVYTDKEQSMERFINNVNVLDKSIKQHIAIENDDKSYNIEDVLNISKRTNLPVIFDNLHNSINPAKINESEAFWIRECKKTWKKSDGNQKIHYSQQEPNKRLGSHSCTIKIQEFLDFYNRINSENLDIMLEVKDKNLSAVKCINCVNENKNILTLEKEWSKYKYYVLEKSPRNYNQIRQLLKDKAQYPAVNFYEIIENTLILEYDFGKSFNAIEHVWGYFKNIANEKEKAGYFRLIKRFENQTISLNAVKNYLYRLALKYRLDYLINSYFFTL